MGDEELDHDSIWTPASGATDDADAPDDPADVGDVPADAADDGTGDPLADETDELWDPVPRDQGPRPPRNRVRTALGVGCLVIAALAVVAIATGGDDPEPRQVGQAVSTTPKGDGASVLSSEEDAKDPEPTGSALVPSTVPEGAKVGCGDWDAVVSFEPETLPSGVVIWSDFDGWHVRASGTDLGVVTGKISGTVRPNLIDQPEPDRVDASAPENGTDLFFTIRPGEEPEGFDFTAGCSQKLLGFELKSDAEPMDPAQVHLGRAGGVESVPFIVSRIPEPS